MGFFYISAVTVIVCMCVYFYRSVLVYLCVLAVCVCARVYLIVFLTCLVPSCLNLILPSCSVTKQHPIYHAHIYLLDRGGPSALGNLAIQASPAILAVSSFFCKHNNFSLQEIHRHSSLLINLLLVSNF